MSTTTSHAHCVEELDFLGSRTRIIAEGLIDMVEVPAGNMPPLHVHRRQDEGFYVLDGEMTLFLPGQEITLGPGDYAIAPRDVPHTYRVGDRPARWLVTSSPAGFERFVADVAALEQVDPDTLTAVAAEHGIEILGPPGALPDA